MFLLLRFIPLLLFLISTISLSLLHFYPNSLYLVLVINLLATLIGTTTLIQKSYLENQSKKSISYILLFNTLPLLLITATSLAILFLNGKVNYFSTIIIMNIGLFLYLETNFLYLYYPGKYQINSRENINDYLAITVIFLSMISAYGFMSFLNTKTWKIMLASTFLVLLLQAHSHWVHKIKSFDRKISIFISSLIIVQFIYSISLLPSSIYVNAAFVTILYYLVQTFNFAHFKNQLTNNFIRNHLIISGILILLLILTARWT